MNSLQFLFVGSKTKPSFLIEINLKKKIFSVYQPDEFSKKEEFFERYSLGKLLITTKYNEIIFLKKPVPYKDNLYVPEVIFKIKKKYLFISKTIIEKTNI